MSNDPKIGALEEWNRLARENTENAIVSSMFEATANTSGTIENFATWLLVATAAVGSFFITNANKLLPLVKKNGFIMCGIFLCLSCVFGLLSKMYALNCKVGIDTNIAVQKSFFECFTKYKEEETKIKANAEFQGINLQTGIRLERILEEFYAPLPKWVVWFAKKNLKKNAGNPQIGYLLLIKNWYKQSKFVFLQALSFLIFLVVGFIFVIK
jgi:hypothetical protein